MIKALKYTRYFTIDFIDDDYGETIEIFIPQYRLAVSRVDNELYIVSTDKVRTEPPIWQMIEPNVSDCIKIKLDHQNAKLLTRFPASDIVEIELKEEVVERLKTIYQLQQNLDQLKNIVKQELLI